MRVVLCKLDGSNECSDRARVPQQLLRDTLGQCLACFGGRQLLFRWLLGWLFWIERWATIAADSCPTALAGTIAPGPTPPFAISCGHTRLIAIEAGLLAEGLQADAATSAGADAADATATADAPGAADAANTADEAGAAATGATDAAAPQQAGSTPSDSPGAASAVAAD